MIEGGLISSAFLRTCQQSPKERSRTLDIPDCSPAKAAASEAFGKVAAGCDRVGTSVHILLVLKWIDELEKYTAPWRVTPIFQIHVWRVTATNKTLHSTADITSRMASSELGARRLKVSTYAAQCRQDIQ